ncbi:MAG TPA: beta-galactosidase trimerization domain-containing protein [bacterium]|nr:beta-galactosidase trimerization domain-containing protein [bacterium]
MSTNELRFRQIHLDFHTSEAIPQVGARFDPETFARTLQKAHVNSITCFARCHHGWLYYDSKRFPQLVHPNLMRRDLLREQIDACHRCDIRVPVYITVQWDLLTAKNHPEWTVLEPDGRLAGTPPFEAGFYRILCVNTPYREYLKEITREVLENLPADGVFFDIVSVRSCCCRACQAGMTAQGLDPANQSDRLLYGQQMLDGFKAEMSSFVHDLKPGCSIFYNCGHIGPAHRSSIHSFTHLELESLPSGDYWGYLHFPYTIRFARQLGHRCLGMTGKFHTDWGDFHSFKNQAALEFECFRMLALGAGCSIGDQLHPEGALCPQVYDLVGKVYSQVEAVEPWCRGARPMTEIGVFTPEEQNGDRMPTAVLGAVRMLQEAALQFDVIDSQSDFERYALLILPDRIAVDPQLASKLAAYFAGGGKTLLTFESGLDPAGNGFAMADFGAELQTEQVCDATGQPVRGRQYRLNDYLDYIKPRPVSSAGLAETEYALYTVGLRVTPLPNTTVLADTVIPYFPRLWRHFCSHRQTPSSGQISGAAIIAADHVVYFSHPMFEIYHHWAPRWCKALLLDGIDRLLGERLVRHNGPSTLQISLTQQPGRCNVHLLHYIPERRCEMIDIIEDVIPLHDLEISLRVDRPVQSVTAVPQQQTLAFKNNAKRIEFTLPRLNGHQIVQVAFEESD